MPALGTCLVGTAPFAGERPVEASASGAGGAAAALSPAVLIAPDAVLMGQCEGVLRGVATEASRLLALGAADASVPGLTPRSYSATARGAADDFVLASALLCGATAGEGAAMAALAGFPLYLGEGVRVEFRDVDAFPQITFGEVFR
jgi:hypothetical protein